MAGQLIVISGPSGVGKTTIAQALLRNADFSRVVTATSRAPRPGERDGVDYLFLSTAGFEERLRRGDFLEHALVHGHHYGTPRQAVLDGAAADKRLVLVIDVQGARQVKESAGSKLARIPLTLFFIEPPSFDELERRLRARATDSPEQVERRLATARKEMAERPLYDHIVHNDTVERAAEEILRVLGYRPSP